MKRYEPVAPLETLERYSDTPSEMLMFMGIPSKKWLLEQIEVARKAKDIAGLTREVSNNILTCEEKASADRERWTRWLGQYQTRLALNSADAPTPLTPRYVLRNWIAQQVIERAEEVCQPSLPAG